MESSIGALPIGCTRLRADGSKYWDLPIPTHGAPAIGADGTIYVPGLNGLYAVHPDGFILWKTGASFATPPVIGLDGTIYSALWEYNSSFNDFCAIAPDGFIRWQAVTTCNQTAARCYFSSAATVGADGSIYAPVSGDIGVPYALYPNGSQRWERRAIPPDSEQFTAPVLSNDGVLYVCGHLGTVYAVKASCGLANTPWPIESRNARRTGRASLGDPVRPCFTPLRLAQDRGFQFTMVGEVGKLYTIEVATELGSWNVWTNVALTRVVEHFTDAQATNSNRRFYRAMAD